MTAERNPRYEAVHAPPEGDSTVARLALTAQDCGFDGLVVRNHHDETGVFDRSAIADRYDLDVVSAVEIRSDDRSEVASAITSYRSERTVVCVHGGQFNRLAVEDECVDVLCHPMAAGDFNHVLATAAATNRVAVEFNLGQVLRATGGKRVNAIAGLEKLRTLVEKYDVPYVVSADPTSHLQLRAPRELIGLGKTIGFSPAQIEAGLEQWGTIVAKNRTRQSESFIEPGVVSESYEEIDR